MMHPNLEKLSDELRVSRTSGMTDRERYEIILHNSMHDGLQIEHLYRTLINLIKYDVRVMVCSHHTRPPAYVALVNWGKDKEYQQAVCMHIFNDIYMGVGGHHHLAAIAEILEHPPQIPDGMAGKWDAMCAEYVKYALTNGYLVERSK